ncbi:hypothetical protein ACP70R_020740 [Stipagrostis hirtigluma subsp. patula]
MGNILNLVCETTTLQHWFSKEIQLRRTADHQLELWNILILRALSQHIFHTTIYEKGIVCGRFQLWSILICRAMLENICRKPIYKKRVANDQFQLLGILIFGVISDYMLHIKTDPFINLPEDLQRIILSKLTLKEVVRTCAVSSKWRYLWRVSPRLSFDGMTMCGKDISGKRQYIQKFVNNVYAVLLQYRGRVVEELAIIFDFDTMLVGHLNNWVRFAVSSRTIFLSFDLAPKDFGGRNDRYIFPFKLLDRESLSRLQGIQLSFVSVQPPTGFNGFPNLRKLDLNLVHVNGKDLKEMLSNCRKLAWLRIVRCHPYDELKVTSSLPCLVYLSVAHCEITSISFHAEKLATFEYKGTPVPIDLSKSSELESADIHFYRDTLEHAIRALANVLINVKHLIFNTSCRPPEVIYLVDNPCKFSLLKHLKLLLLFVQEVDSISLASFLSTSRFVEKLELHFAVIGLTSLAQEPFRRLLDRPFNYLKSLCVTGFKACHGQVELLLHIVENAPALEVLTVDMSNKYKYPPEHEEREAKYVDLVHGTAIRYLEGKISPKCTLRLL